MRFDFSFHNPTRIVFGRNKEAAIGAELAAAGIRSVLLVYGGGSIRQNGLYDRVIQSLEAAGVARAEHGGVKSNPVLSHALEGVKTAQACGAQAVLAVGGGSVIDEAKAIAVGAVNEGDLWDFYTARRIEKALPVYTILTLAASGSEMNGNSVLTNEATRQKYSFNSIHTYPRLSILNPELTFSVNAAYTAYGAVDAIAHVIEGYFTKAPGTPLQDELVETIIRSVMRSAAKCLDNPSDYEGRAELMWAATLALNGLTPAGIGAYAFPNHAIEHALSALFDVPHGAGLAVVMPAWMRWHLPQNRAQYERFARTVFGVDNAEAGIAALEAWFRSTGAPTRLGELGIEASQIPAIAQNAARLCADWRLPEYTEAVVAQILTGAL
ncbi:MAG: iron-containing alcohol dehydrogenase [Campylobacterales bacterium]